MKWTVFYYGYGDKELKTFNVFEHGGFREKFRKAVKKYKKREDFESEIEGWLMYYFWSKCEWEVLICPWPYHPDRDKPAKVDIYWQIKNNWDAFAEYAWEHRKEI